MPPNLPVGSERYAMKIKEIDNQHKLDEGVMDSLRSGINTIKANAPLVGQKAQGRATRNSVADNLIGKWNQSVAMDPTLQKNPSALQQFVQKAAPNIPDVPAPTDMTPKGVNEYITTVTGQSLAAAMRDAPDADNWTDRASASLRAQPTKEPIKTDVPGLTITGGASNPNADPTLTFSGKNYSIDDASGKWVDEAGTPANEKMQTVFYTTMGRYTRENAKLLQGFNTSAGRNAGPRLSSGVSITSEEPIIINFKNTDYALNDNGIWAPVKNPKRPESQAMQAFLNKQHDAYLNSEIHVQPPAPAPQTQPPAPAPTQRQSDQAIQSYRNTDAILPAAPTNIDTTNSAPAADVLAQRQTTPITTTDTPSVMRRRNDPRFDPTLNMPPPEATAPTAPTPTAPIPIAPTAPTNMSATGNATGTMAAGNGSYQAPGRVIPPSSYSTPATNTALGWDDPKSSQYVGRREVARRRAAAQAEPSFLNQPVSQLEDSIDLGEVLWRKMKSRRR